MLLTFTLQLTRDDLEILYAICSNVGGAREGPRALAERFCKSVDSLDPTVRKTAADYDVRGAVFFQGVRRVCAKCATRQPEGPECAKCGLAGTWWLGA